MTEAAPLYCYVITYNLRLPLNIGVRMNRVRPLLVASLVAAPTTVTAQQDDVVDHVVVTAIGIRMTTG